VIRYAILYFVLLVVFLALIVGPVVAGKYIKFDVKIPMELLQPTGLNNNDTYYTPSSTRCAGGNVCPKGPGGPNGEEGIDGAAATTAAATTAAAATTDAAARLVRYLAF
jgi:1,3-beta-glucan synthase